MMMIWLLVLLVQTPPDPSVIARGEKIFAQSCSVGYCHGVAGAAGRGPRLRGRKLDPSFVETVTRDGIPNSAMPAWKGRLQDEEIRAVVAYVVSLASASEAAPPANPMPAGVGPAALSGFQGPAEARPGHDLFFDATRISRCGTCHAVAGRGISIGPDLMTSAEPALPRGLPPKHVITARLKNGELFPALRLEQDERFVKLYDLSTAPPVLRTLERSEITSLVEGSNWSHDSAVRNYSADELRAIITYLRWLKSSPGK
jgi:mono/diheme cytochrome c family protein